MLSIPAWPVAAESLSSPFHLSASGELPDWSRLDPYQRTISRADFVHEWTSNYYGGQSPANASPLITILDDRVRIVKQFKRPAEIYELFFAPSSGPPPPGRIWRGVQDLPPAASLDKPLDGLRIAIDPGHIGGEWARMEQRWFLIPERPVPGDPKSDAVITRPPPNPATAPRSERVPVKEGEIVLRVAELLEQKLTKQGARVALVRRLFEPVTRKRPQDFLEEARLAGGFPVGTDPETNRALASAAERMFYLSDEIRARATKINRLFKPDFAICLHVNAEPWGDPENPDFVAANHFHMLINGTYSDAEIAFDDQRFELLHRLVERMHPEEEALSATVAGVVATVTGLPAYLYPGSNARRTPVSEYVWSRNLLATRVYECPVVFLEPYVMNNQVTHDRVQAGEYHGNREILGNSYVNLYEEYADSVATGVVTYFRNHRRQ